LALPVEYGDISSRMTFDDAKSNFFRAARHGLEAQFNWLDGQTYTSSSLILDHLLPIARQGLMNSEVTSTDIDKYLGIIQERAQTRQTGARWIVKSFAKMTDVLPKDTRRRRLTSAMLDCQKENQPVHTWPEIQMEGSDDWEQGYRTVAQFMTTELFTVHPDDLIDLAASVMDWRHIRHVPVEDREGHLLGLVTHRMLLRLLTKGTRAHSGEPITVREIMLATPVTISPSTPSLEAIKLMQNHRIGCLPVVENDHLVGIVTSYDFLAASAHLFEQHLAVKPAPPTTLACSA